MPNFPEASIVLAHDATAHTILAMAIPETTDVARRVGFTAALSRVWYWALAIGAYSVIPVALGPVALVEHIDLAGLVDAVLAFILGLLLVFRINRAYERWWEARTLWGSLVNVSPNLAIKAKTLVEPDDLERARLRALIVGFSYALKDHLRNQSHLRDVPGFEKTEDDPRHVPAYIVEQIYGVFAAWRATGRITPEDSLLLDREARVFLDVTGGCERIKNTLMSQSFPSLARQTLVLYLLYLPWSMATEFGYYTVLFTVLVAYFVIAAEGIATFVERPFGLDDDHLDLPTICLGIDQSVTEILER